MRMRNISTTENGDSPTEIRSGSSSYRSQPQPFIINYTEDSLANNNDIYSVENSVQKFQNEYPQSYYDVPRMYAIQEPLEKPPDYTFDDGYTRSDNNTLRTDYNPLHLYKPPDYTSVCGHARSDYDVPRNRG